MSLITYLHKKETQLSAYLTKIIITKTHCSNPLYCILMTSKGSLKEAANELNRRCHQPQERNNNNNCIQRRNSRFCTISSLCCKLSPTCTLWPTHNRVHITSNTSSTHHMQHVVLRATQYEGTAQLLSLTV